MVCSVLRGWNNETLEASLASIQAELAGRNNELDVYRRSLVSSLFYKSYVNIKHQLLRDGVVSKSLKLLPVYNGGSYRKDTVHNDRHTKQIVAAKLA